MQNPNERREPRNLLCARQAEENFWGKSELISLDFPGKKLNHESFRSYCFFAAFCR
jgi:hypothetical protein